MEEYVETILGKNKLDGIVYVINTTPVTKCTWLHDDGTMDIITHDKFTPHIHWVPQWIDDRIKERNTQPLIVSVRIDWCGKPHLSTMQFNAYLNSVKTIKNWIEQREQGEK